MHNGESIDEGLHPAREQTSHEAGAVGGTHPGKAKMHNAAVGPGFDDNDLAEILVVRQRYSAAGDRAVENVHIGNRRRQLRNPVHVVSVRSEPHHHGAHDVLVREDHEAC
jgi:hypothetical protein